ncbi:protein Lines homolog 1-like isoform X1 [Lacerta agilis]|uniref:protein Lines homolog 1-like isoform X1 n=1 Tax=Lacerta agilis TaxID=80427 RepID=UPI00141A0276|nr:protein Lines homolog 1-like isoform X1 [Lacerta agilis]
MTENTKFSHNGDSLQQMYDDMLVDALFLKDSHSCAALLNPPISLQHLSSTNRISRAMSLFSPNTGARNSSDPAFTALKTDDEPDTSESVIRSVCHSREIMLLQLTLIKMMLSKIQSQGVAVESKQKYVEIIRILLKEANIDSKLIHLLLISDKQLSYQASKALVFLVHFQLTEEGSLNSAWFAFCSEALSGFPKSSHVAECLWTLTNVIREILKDEGLCKGGGLQKILTSLDNVLEDFYNRIPSSYSEIAQDIPVSAKATNDLSSFLDLLELLVASRTQTPLNLVCQRMLLLNVSCVLGLVTSPVHDLIKKKAIVLLKKCVLHKAGEDLIKGNVPSSSHPNLHFAKDRLVFADVVLQFVATGWLNRFTLSEKASHYGGSQVKPEVGICCNPAQVTLRALSLVLLKALEVKITDSASEAEARVHLESIMHPLLAFLKSHVWSSHTSEHPCAWLSALFIEQDDDMLEAAKTLLTVHLKFERMAHIIKFVNSWFWWENIWMPANCSWANFEDQNGYVFPKPRQLLVTIPYTFGILAIRFFVERCIAAPLANLMGIKSMKRVRPQKNPTLETFFKTCTKRPSQLEIRGLAKKCNWTVHLVEKWFRRRRNLEIPTMHKKFQEACWRFLFYLTSCIAGIVFLYDKPWLYDIWQVWANYPFHSLLASQYWYYILQMSFYSSLLLTLGFDTKRKDFKAHVVHHFAALALMFCSWSSNHVRIGTLVMLIHDCADFWLEAAKIFKYAHWERACSFFFVIFSIVFFTTRIIFFPFWILRATMIYPLYYTQTFALAYILYNGPLLILQGLHLYWGYLVLKILKKFIFIKNVKDVRSDEEEEDSFSDVEEECTKNGSKNGLSHPLLNNNNH